MTAAILLFGLALTGCNSPLDTADLSKTGRAAAAGESDRSAPVVADAGVGPITRQTTYDRATFAALLPGYEWKNEEIGGSEGTTVAVITASRGGKRAMTVYGGSTANAGPLVDRILITDPAIHTATGVAIGDSFSRIYGGETPAGCKPGGEEYSGKVFCTAPEIGNVSLIFWGTWNGPDGALPPDDVLTDWTVEQMVWKAI